jgi:general secretion pathway protein A
MYTAFFGLQQEPFSIAPDPRFLYMSDKHREALQLLGYGLTRGASFVLLTGEIGAGKTTVWRRFLEELPSNYDVASVVNPKLDTNALLARVFEDLGVELPADGKSVDLIDALHGHLLLAHAQGRRTLIVIDEAQALSNEVLEQLRLLTNLDSSGRKLQVMLIGQPELRQMLQQPQLEPLAQRVGRPLSPALPFRERDRGLHRPPPGGGRAEGTVAVRRRVARPDPPALPRRAAAHQRHLRSGDVERPGHRQPAGRPGCGRARGRRRCTARGSPRRRCRPAAPRRPSASTRGPRRSSPSARLPRACRWRRASC